MTIDHTADTALSPEFEAIAAAAHDRLTVHAGQEVSATEEAARRVAEAASAAIAPAPAAHRPQARAPRRTHPSQARQRLALVQDARGSVQARAHNPRAPLSAAATNARPTTTVHHGDGVTAAENKLLPPKTVQPRASTLTVRRGALPHHPGDTGGSRFDRGVRRPDTSLINQPRLSG
jgi:hypothetical protein